MISCLFLFKNSPLLPQLLVGCLWKHIELEDHLKTVKTVKSRKVEKLKSWKAGSCKITQTPERKRPSPANTRQYSFRHHLRHLCVNGLSSMTFNISFESWTWRRRSWGSARRSPRCSAAPREADRCKNGKDGEPFPLQIFQEHSRDSQLPHINKILRGWGSMVPLCPHHLPPY